MQPADTDKKRRDDSELKLRPAKNRPHEFVGKVLQKDRYLELDDLECGTFAKKLSCKIDTHDCPLLRFARIFGVPAGNYRSIRYNIHAEKLADGTFDVCYLAFCVRFPRQKTFEVMQFSLEFELIRTWAVILDEFEDVIEDLMLIPGDERTYGPSLVTVCTSTNAKYERTMRAVSTPFSKEGIRKTVAIPQGASFVRYHDGLACYWPQKSPDLMYFDGDRAISLKTEATDGAEKIFLIAGNLVRNDGIKLNGKLIGMSDTGTYGIIDCANSGIAVVGIRAKVGDPPALIIPMPDDRYKNQNSTILAASSSGFVLVQDMGLDSTQFVSIVRFCGENPNDASTESL